MSFWHIVSGTGNGAYHVNRLIDEAMGMTALRKLFPNGEADSMNMVMFSTSGVHGHYFTIEDMEAKVPGADSVTFMVIQPRLVVLRYGNVKPETKEDFAFLKKLRSTSWTAMANVGRHWGN